MKTRFILLTAIAAPLLLTGCGEGWEMQLTNTVFPYGNERTAGSGIAYVRAKMMPEKELNMQMVSEERAPEVVEVIESEPEPEKKAEKIFKKAQTKSQAKAKK